MSFISGFLLRMASGPLGKVLSQLTQQLNVVDEQALSPMRAIIQQVTSGVWIGEGANAFVDEVSSMLIPGVGDAMRLISTMSANLQFARDTIEHADEEVSRMVQGSLSDAFNFF